jgi:ATP-binding cassette subfamily B protein
LRRFVGATRQSPFLFNETIGANIAYADPEIDDDRIREAADISQIAADIAGMSDGYATQAGPGGGGLSGGQRQRIDLARTLLPDPRLLVLDDVTSALDPLTRAALVRALRERAADRFTILISSRADLARHADEILVLDHGRIVERGSHAQLLAIRGRYWRLSQLETAQATNAVPMEWS